MLMRGDGIMVTELQDGKNQKTLIGIKGDSFFDMFQARPMSTTQISLHSR